MMDFLSSGVSIDPWVLILLGFSVGVCGSFFGIGGAFLVTPALNILGLPMTYAIGTDLAHITGKSVVASMRHHRMGNVDVRAGLLLILGTVPGVEAGSRVVMWLERIGEVDSVVRVAYILLLGGVGSVMLGDALRRARWPAGGEGSDKPRWSLATALRSLRWPPLVSLPRSGIECVSVWLIVGIAFATGFCAGFLGVGGGFIRMPALLYLLGMPTRIAVGTDLLEVMFSGAYGTFTYALKGRVDLAAALTMLLGASVGSHLGALATSYVEGYRIRLLFALTVLASALGVALKQMGHGQAAAAVLLSAGGITSLFILAGLAAGIARQKGSIAVVAEGKVRSGH